MDMKRILQAFDGVAEKPKAQPGDMAKFLAIVDSAVKEPQVEQINEGKNPHKVTLPVQMAMQHYQQAPVEKKRVIGSGILNKYVADVEDRISEELQQRQQKKRQLVNQYAQTIAERVLMREGKETALDKFRKGADERKVKHDRIEKDRQAAAAKGKTDVKGAVDRLEKNLSENEHHSPEDLGGADAYYGRPADHRAHNLDDHEHIRAYYHGYRSGEDAHHPDNYNESLRTDNPCWKGYKPVGTKKKGGKTVPNCVPKE
jgi:hypothetical protein